MKKFKNFYVKTVKKFIDSKRYYNLCVDKFKEILENCLFDANCNCSEIIEDKSQPGRILFNNRIIYLLNIDDYVIKIFELRMLCNSIAFNDAIAEEIKGENEYTIYSTT